MSDEYDEYFDDFEDDVKQSNQKSKPATPHSQVIQVPEQSHVKQQQEQPTPQNKTPASTNPKLKQSKLLQQEVFMSRYDKMFANIRLDLLNEKQILHLNQQIKKQIKELNTQATKLLLEHQAHIAKPKPKNLPSQSNIQVLSSQLKSINMMLDNQNRQIRWLSQSLNECLSKSQSQSIVSGKEQQIRRQQKQIKKRQLQIKDLGKNLQNQLSVKNSPKLANMKSLQTLDLEEKKALQKISELRQRELSLENQIASFSKNQGLQEQIKAIDVLQKEITLVQKQIQSKVTAQKTMDKKTSLLYSNAKNQLQKQRININSKIEQAKADIQKIMNLYKTITKKGVIGSKEQAYLSSLNQQLVKALQKYQSLPKISLPTSFNEEQESPQKKVKQTQKNQKKQQKQVREQRSWSQAKVAQQKENKKQTQAPPTVVQQKNQASPYRFALRKNKVNDPQSIKLAPVQLDPKPQEIKDPVNVVEEPKGQLPRRRMFRRQKGQFNQFIVD